MRTNPRRQRTMPNSPILDAIKQASIAACRLEMKNREAVRREFAEKAVACLAFDEDKPL
jgi:hypothetical protein